MSMSIVTFVLVSLAAHCYFAQGIKHLPTFSWDAKNPLFECTDPVIRMPVNTQLDVHCPQTFIHNYLRDIQYLSSIPKIRMVQAMDEDHYQKCNATGAQPNLYCGESNTENGQQCDIPGRGCTPYYNIFTGSVANRLEPGRIYYFIGTDNTGNTSPCQGGNGARPMKLKIYVCTEAETRNGQCEPCRTEACFYKTCSEQCGEWQSSRVYKDLSGKCYQHKTRTCTNKLTAASSNKTEEIEVECPEPECGLWEDDGSIRYVNDQCVVPQKQTCTLDGVEQVKKQDRPVTCPKTECHDWKIEKTTIMEKPKSCFKTEKRICLFDVNSQDGVLKVVYDEYKETNISCPQPKIITIYASTTTSPPTKQTAEILPIRTEPTRTTENTPKVLPIKNRQQEEDVSKYIYITIGASIGALIVGIAIGYCLSRLCQVKQEPVEVVKTVEKVIPMEGIGPIMSYDNKNFHLDPVLEDTQSFSMGDIAFIPTTQEIGTTKRQVMVARSVSFYNPDLMNNSNVSNTMPKQHRQRNNSDSDQYRPPRTIHESRRNVMRHPSATSKTVLIRHHSDVTERPRSDSDTSVFNLKPPEDMTSEEV